METKTTEFLEIPESEMDITRRKVVTNGNTPVEMLKDLVKIKVPKNAGEIKSVCDFIVYVAHNYPNK